VWKIRRTNVPPYTGLKIYEQASAATGQTAAATVAPKPMAANAIPTLRPSASAVPDNPPPAATSAAAVRPGTAAPDLVRGPVATRPGTVPGNLSMPAPQPQRAATRAPTELVKPAAAPPTHPITSLDSPPLQQVPAKPASNPTPPPSASASAPAATPAPAAMSGVVLQIGSYKSEAEARHSWSAFRAEHGAAAGYQPDVKSADLGAKGRWYRLRMGPFADRKSALEVCAKLKADGASCLLAQ